MLISRNWRSHWVSKFVIFLASWIVFLSIFYLLKVELFTGGINKKSRHSYILKHTILSNNENVLGDRPKYGHFIDIQSKRQPSKPTEKSCSKFSDCFNFEKCEKNGFKIYIFPPAENEFRSEMNRIFIGVLKNLTHLIVDDPEKACLFILPFDMMDRDPLSKNFVKRMNSKLSKFEYWNNGGNNIIFNLFSGTWSYYVDSELAFNFGKAFLIKASYSLESIRQNVDISMPLIPSNHPITISNVKYVNRAYKLVSKEKNVDIFPVRRKYLITFKGKRYLLGTGSQTRDSLHLLHNGKDIILLTTCRHHGSEWEKFKDSRCDEDNENYDRFDYLDLLQNSTFCLVPRGRRLGSFRFLEAMKSGCIPVSLSNGWDLPFSEVIDWSKFSFIFDEHIILQIPSILRRISDEEILSKRQHLLFIWNTYFESIAKIMQTSLEILKARIYPDLNHPYISWNKPPGVLKLDASFTTSPTNLPFYHHHFHSNPKPKFTAMIVAVSPVFRSSSPLFRLIKAINLSENVDQNKWAALFRGPNDDRLSPWRRDFSEYFQPWADSTLKCLSSKILVIWLPETNIPDKTKWPHTSVTLRVIHPPKKDMNARFVIMDLINTDAVFTFDEDVVIKPDEIDFACVVWRSNPSQLVGFHTASHYEEKTAKSSRLKYTSKYMNEYSMVKTSSAIFHKFYSHMYINKAPAGLHELVERSKTCESLAMNFLISHITNKPPIKVARSSTFNGGDPIKERLGMTYTYEDLFETHEICFQELIRIFNRLPLVLSSISLNPVLYKDPVSISRKKYRTLE